MKVTVVVQDGLIIVDGDVRQVSFIAAGEWAIQFNGFTAEIEYTDSRQNETISADEFFDRYQYLIDAHTDKVAADLAEEKAARIAAEEEAARIAAKEEAANKKAP